MRFIAYNEGKVELINEGKVETNHLALQHELDIIYRLDIIQVSATAYLDECSCG
jgi:hypothetical protein